MKEQSFLSQYLEQDVMSSVNTNASLLLTLLTQTTLQQKMTSKDYLRKQFSVRLLKLKKTCEPQSLKLNLLESILNAEWKTLSCKATKLTKVDLNKEKAFLSIYKIVFKSLLQRKRNLKMLMLQNRYSQNQNNQS